MSIEKVFLRTAYNYDRDAVSNETGLSMREDEEIYTVQSERDECDINTIVRRFGLTGELPNNLRLPEYGDFEEVVDYHTAMNAVVAAQETFMQLPPDLRYKFHNNPQEFLEFCHDDANRDEARKLGLLAPEVPVPAPVVGDPAVPVAPAPVPPSTSV